MLILSSRCHRIHLHSYWYVDVFGACSPVREQKAQVTMARGTTTGKVGSARTGTDLKLWESKENGSLVVWKYRAALWNSGEFMTCDPQKILGGLGKWLGLYGAWCTSLWTWIQSPKCQVSQLVQHCTPVSSAGERGQRDNWGSLASQSSWVRKFRAQWERDPASKNKRENNWERYQTPISLHPHPQGPSRFNWMLEKIA